LHNLSIWEAIAFGFLFISSYLLDSLVFARRCDLGIHCRNISQRSASVWTSDWEFYPLDIGSHHHFTFPYLAETLGGGITFSFFALMMVFKDFLLGKSCPKPKEQVSKILK
jgi:hypothetical protein